MPASITPHMATKTKRPSAKLATRRLIGVRMKSSAIGIMNSMIPKTVARIVGLHSFAVDMVARPLETTARRSEEHTSELQSLMRTSYAVFCLKKKSKHPDSVTQAERTSCTHVL